MFRSDGEDAPLQSHVLQEGEGGLQNASGAPSQVLLSKFSGLSHQLHQRGEHRYVTRLKTHLLDLRQQKGEFRSSSSGTQVPAMFLPSYLLPQVFHI